MEKKIGETSYSFNVVLKEIIETIRNRQCDLIDCITVFQSEEEETGIFGRRTMADQALRGLCYQETNLTILEAQNERT